jgi:transcriptional regulator with XRE-family HTH domain
MTTDTRFGRVLRRLRTDRGLDMQTIEERGDIGWGNVSRLERGDRQPTREMVGRLAEAMALTPVYRELLFMAAGFVPDRIAVRGGNGAGVRGLIEAARALNAGKPITETSHAAD